MASIAVVSFDLIDGTSSQRATIDEELAKAGFHRYLPSEKGKGNYRQRSSAG